MAFEISRLENHSGSGRGLKLFSYKNTGDAVAAMKAANYFNDGSTLLSVGDRIACEGSDGGFDCRVSAVSGAGVVTVAAVPAF